MKRKPILVPSLVVSTHAIPNIFKNVPPLFSSFQQSIKYYYHCSDIINAYVNDMLPIFMSAINGNGVDLLVLLLSNIDSKVFWFSGHHWNIHLLAEYCFIFCAHMRRYCSSQQGKPLAGASARGLGGFGQDLRSIWQPNSRLGRRVFSSGTEVKAPPHKCPKA